jgi:uncharacterized repeat protein (TIGR01451 family)
VQAVILNGGAANAQDVVVQFSDATDSSSVPIGPQQVIPAIPAGGSAVIQVTYPTQDKAGSRSISVAVDPNNFIAESRETDNTAKATLEVHAPAMPNLVVVGGNVTVDPPAPTEGQIAHIRAVIFNHGAREARDVVVQVMDTTAGGLEPVGAPQSIALIPPGSAATVQVPYDTTGKQGERSIQVTADPNNFIEESDESDNRATKPLPVGAPPAANLVVLASNVEFDPAEPNDGDLVTVKVTVMNNGTATATDVVVRFEDVTDGTPVLIGRQRLIDSIAPGESATAQVTYDTTDKAGERRIEVTVDPTDMIAESDEQDNRALALLTVAPPPAPDLVVQGENIRFSPASPTEGQVVTITVTVLNEGPRNANKVEVKFLDVTNGGSTQIGNLQIIGGVPSGGSGMAQVTYDTTGKAGDRTIQVVADPNSLVTETDETNNQAEATLTVAPPSEEPEPGIQPNLVITPGSLSFTPTMPMPGDLVTLTISVTNSGEGSASDVVVRVTDTTDDEPLPVGEDQTIPSLAASSSATVTVSYDTTDKTGNRTLTVEVDPDETITETNESDNQATVTIPLGGSGEPGEPGEGEPGEGGPGEGNPGEGEPGEGTSPPDEGASVPGADATQGRGEQSGAPLKVEMADDLIRRPNAEPGKTP